jgi:hypothetical protein
MIPPSTNSNVKTNSAAGLPNGTVVTAVPQAPLPTVEGRLASGVIPKRLLDDDLLVWIPGPWIELTQPGSTDYIVFVWHVVGLALPVYVAPIPVVGELFPGDFPLPVYIPSGLLLNDAVVDLSYRIHNDQPDAAVANFSPPVRIIIDRSAPGKGEVLKAPVFSNTVITTPDLDNNLTLDVVVPGDYKVRATLDEIFLWFMNSNSVPAGLPIHVEKVVAITGAIILKVLVSEFRKFSGAQELFAVYRVKDEAGNISQLSLPASVLLSLTPLPGNLPVPTVPAFDFDQLIKRDDARNIVSFGISSYTNFIPGDLCIPELAGVKLPPIPVTSFPFTGTLTWQQLIANGSDLQRKDKVPFRYYIRRASDTVGPGTLSPLKLLNMDFTVFGRDHNQAPALLNPLLDLVNAYGAVSNTANKLDSRDSNQPVRVEARLSGNPQPGDMLSLYWPGQAAPVATYTVKLGDTAGALIVFDPRINWSIIQAGGNTTAYVYYVTTNGVNEQQSGNQSVVINITPPMSFPKPTFPQNVNHPNKIINCTPGLGPDGKPLPFLWEEFQIQMTPGVGVWPGDLCTLAFQGFDDFPDRNPLVSTALTLSHTWGINQVSHIFKITDYQNIIKPLRDYAGASAKYSVFRGGVLIGVSKVGYVQIDLKYSTGRYCGPA